MGALSYIQEEINAVSYTHLPVTIEVIPANEELGVARKTYAL